MSDFNYAVQDQKKVALTIDVKDNVAMALQDLVPGDQCLIRKPGGEEEEIKVIDQVNFGHKIALEDINTDEPVYKYGEIIGQMSKPVKQGGFIHVHNMYCDRGKK